MTLLCLMRETIRWTFNYSRWHPTADEWIRALSMVQTEERLRIKRFVFRRDAKSALVGRLLIRKAIGQCLGIPCKELCLGRTDKGKPVLLNDISSRGIGFEFNIAHHGDYTVLAAECWDCKNVSSRLNNSDHIQVDTSMENDLNQEVTNVDRLHSKHLEQQNKTLGKDISDCSIDRPSAIRSETQLENFEQVVCDATQRLQLLDAHLTNEKEPEQGTMGLAVGVDVMCIERPMGSKSVDEFFTTMDRQFTPQEWRIIRRGCGERDQLSAFYRLWCLKESFVKAVGTGIGFSLQRLDFHVHSPLPPHGYITDTALYVDDQLLAGWTFQECMLDHSHIACVATAKISDNFWGISLESPLTQKSVDNRLKSNSVAIRKSRDINLKANSVGNHTEPDILSSSLSLEAKVKSAEVKWQECKLLQEYPEAKHSPLHSTALNEVKVMQFRELSLDELFLGVEPLYPPQKEDWKEFEGKEECPRGRGGV